MIHERESAVEKSERHDLLSNLLEANDHDADRVALTESELICMFFVYIYEFHIFQLMLTNGFPIANVYMFLVAGHEVCNPCTFFTLLIVEDRLII